jgi:hypothetical protein
MLAPKSSLCDPSSTKAPKKGTRKGGDKMATRLEPPATCFVHAGNQRTCTAGPIRFRLPRTRESRTVDRSPQGSTFQRCSPCARAPRPAVRRSQQYSTVVRVCTCRYTTTHRFGQRRADPFPCPANPRQTRTRRHRHRFRHRPARPHRGGHKRGHSHSKHQCPGASRGVLAPAPRSRPRTPRPPRTPHRCTSAATRPSSCPPSKPAGPGEGVRRASVTALAHPRSSAARKDTCSVLRAGSRPLNHLMRQCRQLWEGCRQVSGEIRQDRIGAKPRKRKKAISRSDSK